MFRFFGRDLRKEYDKEYDEIIRSFLSTRELFYTNYAIPSFNLPKNEQAFRKRVEAPFNFLNSKLPPPARFLENLFKNPFKDSVEDSVRKAIISYQDEQDEFEKATECWKRFLNFERLISELSGCLLKYKALLQKNNFVTAVILVILTLSGELRNLSELRNSGEIRNSSIPPWLKTLADFDECYAQFLSFTHEVATFTPHPDWLGTKLEDCLDPDNDNKQSFYYDWLRAKIYFQGKPRSLSAEAAENEEIRKTEIETLLEEMTTFWDKKDENIKKGLTCMHQNSTIFSPVTQLFLFAGTWITCLNTNSLGKRFDSYRKRGDVIAYRFERFSWGLLCTVEVSPKLIHIEHSESVINQPVTFVGQFELARECTHLKNVVFKCYGIEEDRKGFESVFSTFTSEEIENASKLLTQKPETPTPTLTDISGSILTQRVECLANRTETKTSKSTSLS